MFTSLSISLIFLSEELYALSKFSAISYGPLSMIQANDHIYFESLFVPPCILSLLQCTKWDDEPECLMFNSVQF